MSSLTSADEAQAPEHSGASIAGELAAIVEVSRVQRGTLRRNICEELATMS